MPSTATTTPIWETLEYASTAFGWVCVMPIATAYSAVNMPSAASGWPHAASGASKGRKRIEPDDADLHHRTRQHRRRRDRRGRMRERHPDVQRREPGLDAESDHEERQREVAMRGRRQRRRSVAHEQAVARCQRREHDERHQRERFSGQREADVDRGGAACTGRVVVHHEAGRTEREQTQQRVQAHHVGRDEDPEAAGERHQPAHREASRLG